MTTENNNSTEDQKHNTTNRRTSWLQGLYTSLIDEPKNISLETPYNAKENNKEDASSDGNHVSKGVDGERRRMRTQSESMSGLEYENPSPQSSSRRRGSLPFLTQFMSFDGNALEEPVVDVNSDTTKSKSIFETLNRTESVPQEDGNPSPLSSVHRRGSFPLLSSLIVPNQSRSRGSFDVSREMVTETEEEFEASEVINFLVSGGRGL